MSASPYVVETTAADFDRDVRERSRETPVVVDFWAGWCQPCRMLGPVLEQLADEFAGKFVLVKADVDQLPDAALTFRVQSIPAVFAVLDGEIVDFFQGVLPRGALLEWLGRVVAAGELLQGRRLEATDPAGAEALYRRRLAEAPRDGEAKIALTRVVAAQGRVDEARTLLAELADRGFLEPEAQRLQAELDLVGHEGDDLDALRQAAAGGDFASRLALARGLAGQHAYAEALELCLELVEHDRPATGEEARKLMLEVFQVLGDSPLATDYRQRLSLLLF